MAKIGWNAAFNGVQAIATAAIAAIAIWGIFFTDLPNVLIRQLRADVTEAREQLIEIRRHQ